MGTGWDSVDEDDEMNEDELETRVTDTPYGGDPDDVVKEEHKGNEFYLELRALINKHSKENGSNTPDWILAEFLNDQLKLFDLCVGLRDRWYGKELKPGSGH